MTDTLLALVPTYGPWLMLVVTLLACLAVPIPASILMLTAGGFIASGDLPLTTTVGATLAGALLGDQIGYGLGRYGGAWLLAGLGHQAAPLEKATAMLARRGGFAVFLTRWLFSPLGPYVNLAAGAARQPWPRFTAWEAAGECVWVGLYLGFGYAFTGNLEVASGIIFESLGLLAAGAVAIGLGLWLVSALRAERHRDG